MPPEPEWSVWEASNFLTRWRLAVYLAVMALGSADLDDICGYICNAGARRDSPPKDKVQEALKELEGLGVICEVSSGRVLPMYAITGTAKGMGAV